MKKSILIATATLLTFYVSAQSRTTADEKVISVEEANRMNGTVMPTINGKPYNQYKAEQEALKKEREAKLIAAKTNNADAANTMILTNTASNTNVAPAKQKVQQPITKPEVKPVEKQQPQVPDQFKLPVAQAWPATAVPDKSTPAAPSAQQVNTQVPDTKAASTTTPAKKQD